MDRRFTTRPRGLSTRAAPWPPGGTHLAVNASATAPEPAPTDETGGRDENARRSSRSWPDLAGRRVLAVADEPETLDLLRRILEAVGAEVRPAASADAALAQLASWPAQVLVSAVPMRGLTGYDLIRTVREWEDDTGGQLPAIAVAGSTASEDEDAAIEAGYQACLSKPLDPQELVHLVASAAGVPVVV